MAVSYKSQTFKNTPYILPDLNLLAKVLSVKQTQFDQNSQLIQNKVNSMASLDVMRGVDRDYLNEKINNTVKNINDLGGVDVSDYNISNQIDSYASNIYSDQNVLNAVSSTKKARSLMSSYEKMKTDPKLMKYYSEANETIDSEGIQSWMASTDLGKGYNGPSSATPYEDYNEDYNKIFKNIIPQQFTKVTTGNGYIEKETGQVLSEKAVFNIAQGMLTPKQRSQMERDAKYLYKYKAGYGKEQLVSKALTQRDNKVQEEAQILKQLNAAYLVTTGKDKDDIKKQIIERQDYLSSLNATRNSEINEYSKQYDNNPNEFMYKVYSEDYFSALGKRYAVNKVDKTVVADQLVLEKYRQDNQNARLVETLKNAKELQDSRNDTQLRVAGIRKGNGKDDPNDPFNPLAVGNINPNKSTLNEDQKVQVAIAKSDAAKQQMDAIKNEYINGLIAEHPEMTKDDADLSFKMLSEAMAEKTQMKDGMIKNLPKGFGEKLEQYNLFKLEKDTYDRHAYFKELTRPQYLTKVITPDEQNNSKDEYYPIYESIKIDLKNKGLINDTKDVEFKEIYNDELEGYKISYTEGTGKKQGEVKEVVLSPEKSKALGYAEPPNNLGILNRTIGNGKDFVTYVQNEQDPNFVGKIRIYKIKDGQFGAQYMYGSNTPINLLKTGVAATPADAYARASTYIKKYRSGDVKGHKYQTKIDFEKDMGIVSESTQSNTTDYTPADLQRMGIQQFK